MPKMNIYPFIRLIGLKQLKCLTICISLLIVYPIASAQTKGATWEPPKAADNVKNPVTVEPASLKEAKTMYTTYCTPCHGDKGKGDGVAAAGLPIKPADHSSIKVQGQTDGALFWEMSEGHNPMPSYKKAFTDKQRWQLVNYIRTLAKKSKN
jgi:mono/diheme cytochrome c family protein